MEINIMNTIIYKGNVEELKGKGGIYKISCGNKVYIGSTCDLYTRLSMHNRRVPQEYITMPLYKEVRNNNKDWKFEVLEYEELESRRIIAENAYIMKYSNNKRYECLNQKKAFLMPPITKEIRQKLSTSHKGLKYKRYAATKD